VLTKPNCRGIHALVVDKPTFRLRNQPYIARWLEKSTLTRSRLHCLVEVPVVANSEGDKDQILQLSGGGGLAAKRLR
jgi:hypothetical protein